MKKIFITIFTLSLAIYCFAQSGGSFSKELQNKFKAISDKLCWDIMVEQNNMAKEHGEELPENHLKLMAYSASTELMEKYQNAFTVPEAEAKKFLSGEYDDFKNKNEFDNCVKELADLSVSLPLSIRYLIEKSHSQKLSGLELEFAVRLFKEYLKQISNL
ncbi:MAG: hypothetical protein PHQ96_05205 [Candidatus Omnitrophica bacterium]|nr:hypothetical protein [Candidatus Omnitrophota bacterium]